jgi:hypothetical protein
LINPGIVEPVDAVIRRIAQGDNAVFQPDRGLLIRLGLGNAEAPEDLIFEVLPFDRVRAAWRRQG